MSNLYLFSDAYRIHHQVKYQCLNANMLPFWPSLHGDALPCFHNYNSTFILLLFPYSAANVTTFFPAVIVSSFISLSEMLSDACLTLCESYHKGSVHPNYFSIAALCGKHCIMYCKCR